jgi:NAD(P)-dependent dehydrogenase (short-subunit alcohol dehydrogenase family)
MQLRDQRVVLTGGASGIGACALENFVAEGAAQIHVADRDSARLAEVIKALPADSPVVATEVDVSDRVALEHFIRSADAAMGGLDVLVNNAGIMSGAVDFPGTSLEAMNRVIDVNLVAMMIGTRLGIELMHQRGNLGIVLNTASIAAFNPMPADPAYAASKAAIVNFTQSCAPIAASHGVRVMAICPGVTDTAIVPHDAEWLKPALARVEFLTPDEIVAVMLEVIGDETLFGDYVRVDNRALTD